LSRGDLVQRGAAQRSRQTAALWRRRAKHSQVAATYTVVGYIDESLFAYGVRERFQIFYADAVRPH